MTNKIALWLGALIVAGFVLDQVLFEGSAIVFLARKLLDMIEWMAFWR